MHADVDEGHALTLIRNPYCVRWLADDGQWNRLLSGLLIFLTTLLMLLMPITEQLSNWDRFLRGGTDVEFTLLAGLLFAALVLLSTDRRTMQQQRWQGPRLLCQVTKTAGDSGSAVMPARGSFHRAETRSGQLRYSDSSTVPHVLAPLRI